MKSTLFLVPFLLIQSISYAQIVTDDMSDDFKQISKFGTHQSGFEGIQTYHSDEVEGSQFFAAGWSNGSITTTTNEHFGKNYMLLYDKVRQQLFVKWKDSSVVLLADKNQIAAFTLNTDRAHNFVAAGTYDPANKSNFWEVLVKSDTGYSLFKLTKAKFVKADETDMEKQKMGEVHDSFVDEVTYYIFKDGIIKAVALRKNNIYKALPSLKSRISAFYNQHPDSNMDEGLLTALIQELNSR